MKESKLLSQTPQSYVPIRPATKAEQMRECLRSLKQNHKEDDARVKRAFQTLLTYVGNVARNPDEEKFRKIRLTNQSFQRLQARDQLLDSLMAYPLEKTRQHNVFLGCKYQRSYNIARSWRGPQKKNSTVKAKSQPVETPNR
ncbi:hypothetical protein Fmac_005834 [Flemingia macrophylla]|uniref:PUB domain-containing protein n=1 Tax=Flemingia macrophylla TaxID=520843 RepID=A0ABD1N911_9FABA